MPNVALVMSIFTDDLWKESFTFPNYTYSYSAFLRAVAKFPMFCNENNDSSISLDSSCRRELAVILAQITVDTADLQGVSDSNCSDPNNIKAECDYKSGNQKETLIWPPINGVQYYGRGALQLEWN